jgi:hypothetical protein
MTEGQQSLVSTIYRAETRRVMVACPLVGRHVR